MKRAEDEENLFKKDNKPEENEKKKLQLQTGKNIAFSGRPSHRTRGPDWTNQWCSSCRGNFKKIEGDKIGQCSKYVRIETGIEIFGDAHEWFGYFYCLRMYQKEKMYYMCIKFPPQSKKGFQPKS